MYCITNSINGKKYVGQTIRNPKQRFYEHCNKYCKAASLIRFAIRKYGKDKFKFEILETCYSREELNAREAYWIRKLGSLNPLGYNLESGSGKHSAGRANYGALNKIASPKPIKIRKIKGERWKDIPGFKGLYQASNFGRVISVGGLRTSKRWGTLRVNRRLMSATSSGGHLAVLLSKKGFPSTLMLSRAVYSAFFGAIPAGSRIFFKDENPLNCRLDNLVLAQGKSGAYRLGGITKHVNGYQVRVTINKKRHYVGIFKTIEEAETKKWEYISQFKHESQVKRKGK